MKPHKRLPLGHYEELFEEFMKYTHFSSTDEIDSVGKLNEFFDEVNEHSEANDRKAPFKRQRFFKSRMLDALHNIQGGGRRKFKVKPKDIKPIKSIKAAREKGIPLGDFMIPNSDNVNVFKTFHVTKGKKVIRWRDEKGRFAKSP